MSSLRLAGALLAGSTLLLGCPRAAPLPAGGDAGMQVVDVPAPPLLPAQNPLVAVLDGVGMVLLLPRERQQQEIAALSEGLERASLASDRLQLALLLALGDEGIRDSERARKLLQNRSWDAAGYETLTRLVLQLLEERQDHARSRLDAAVALEAERKARLELEARLEAIKAIESDIEARELGNGELGAEENDGDPSADTLR